MQNAKLSPCQWLLSHALSSIDVLYMGAGRVQACFARLQKPFTEHLICADTSLYSARSSVLHPLQRVVAAWCVLECCKRSFGMQTICGRGL